MTAAEKIAAGRKQASAAGWTLDGRTWRRKIGGVEEMVDADAYPLGPPEDELGSRSRSRQPYGGIPPSSALVPHPYQPRAGKTMLTAKASGTVYVDGERVDIRAGRDRVQAGHPIIKAAPHLFDTDFLAADIASARAPETPSWRLPDPSPDDGSWRIGPPPRAPKPGTWADFAWKRSAKHEAAHAAAAHLLGWEVGSVEIHPGEDGGAVAAVYSPVGRTGERRTTELAIIAGTAERYCGWTANGSSYRGDRRMVNEAVEGSTMAERLTSRGQLDFQISRLVQDPRFRRIARAVTDAVLEADGVLKGEALQRALRAR